MECSKCGTHNSEGFKFCVKCGNNLEAVNNESIKSNVPVQDSATEHKPVEETKPKEKSSFNKSNSKTINNVSLNYFKYITSFLLKPFETFKQEENKLSDTKMSLILSGIVAGAMMIINLLTSMISAIFVKTMDYSTFKYKTKIDFEGLKNLDYVSLIFKKLLIYACIIVAIAAIYYLASLVVKKSLNFIKTLSASASAIMPFAVMGMIVSPILGKIWTPLAVVSAIIGVVYSIAIFVTLINDSVKFDRKDFGIYFHSACITILVTAGYYTYINIMTSEITSQIGGYLDLLN